MPLFAELSTQHLFLIGLLATSMFMLFHTRRRWQQSTERRPVEKLLPASQRWDKPHTAALPGDAREWEVQMHEFARDLSARIDSKMAALEHLMRAAHHETLRLEAALARSQGNSPPHEGAITGGAVEFTPISQAQQLHEATRSSPRSAPSLRPSRTSSGLIHASTPFPTPGAARSKSPPKPTPPWARSN